MQPINIDEFEASFQRNVKPVDSGKILAIAIEALSNRALIWLATFGGAFLFGFTVIDPTWIKIAVSVSYCACILFPLLWRDAKEVKG